MRGRRTISGLDEMFADAGSITLGEKLPPSAMAELGNAVEMSVRDFPETPADFAEQAIQRGCVMEMADEFEEHVKHIRDIEDVHFALIGNQKYGKYSLRELLQKRWIMEDKVTANSRDESMKRKLNEIKMSIKARHFSVTRAQKNCRKLKDEPRESVIQECILKFANKRTTMKKKNLMKVSLQRLNITEQAKKELVAHLEKRHNLTRVIRTIENFEDVTKTLGMVFKKVIKKERSELAYVKSLIRDMGFSFTYTEQQCQKDHEIESLTTSSKLLKRVLTEIKEAAHFRKPFRRNCGQRSGHFCPEGTSPQVRQFEFDRRRFLLALAIMNIPVFGEVIQFSLGFLLGFLTGGLGPALSLGGIIAATPGLGFFAVVPLAALFGVDWLPECHCYPTTCAYDADLGSCAMRASNSSSNPFQRLPYPGQKCVPAQHAAGSRLKEALNLFRNQDDSDTENSCALQACTADDYNGQLDSKDFKGVVGIQDSGTYNCLFGVDRTENVHGLPLLFMENFQVDGAAKELNTTAQTLDNSAISRTKLYSSLGLAPVGLQNDTDVAKARGRFLG